MLIRAILLSVCRVRLVNRRLDIMADSESKEIYLNVVASNTTDQNKRLRSGRRSYR